jgi:hypothetical protein
MRVKLKGQVTAADLAKLKDIQRQLCALTIGLHPAAPASTALMAAIWAVDGCARQWSGEDAGAGRREQSGL